MKRSLTLSLLALGLAVDQASAAVTLLDKDNWKVQLGGFAELDIFSDSTRAFNESTSNSAIPRVGTYNGDNGRTTMSVGNSRLAFSVLPPSVDGWQSKGYIEGDFLGPGAFTSEQKQFTNAVFRVRHAYVSSESSSLQLLAGQTWTLLGWQTYYLQPTVAVPASIGTLYQRTPQITAIYNTKLSSLGLQGGLSIVRPVERDSQIPTVDAGVRFSFDGWRGALANSPTGDESTAPLSFAVTGSARDFKFNSATSTTDSTHQEGYVVAVDGYIPILPAAEKDPGNSLAVLGEFSTGRGYADMFPGYTGGLPAADPTKGETLDAGFAGADAGGIHLVNLKSYNVTVQYHLPTDWHSWINVGYAKIDSDNIAALTPAGAAGTGVYNSDEFYFGNVYHDFSKSVRMAVEYSYAKTNYVDGTSNHNNRYQASFWYRF